jgi:deoxyribonuclease I
MSIMALLRAPAVVLAAATLAACAGSPPPAAPIASMDALPFWVAARAVAPGGCAADGAPARPRGGDEAALAAALTWAYRDFPVESYCGCAFGDDQRVRSGCAYADAASAAIRWEPVVPPSRFGVYRHCWQQWDAGDGNEALTRRKCAALDPEFAEMDADLYNYHPALADLSARRAGNPYALVQGEPREFGACDFETQSVMGKSLRVEPPADVRGDLARIYLYMAGKYGKGRDWKIKLSREQRQLYEKWSETDPVDDHERLRACRIAAIQGWENPYVK